MASKITKDIDKEILTYLALGYKGKDIAKLCKVSSSYVSMIKQGKKNSTEKEINDIINSGDYTNILNALNSTTIDLDEALEYSKEQFTKAIVKAKLWEYLIEKIKEIKSCN